MNNSKCCNAPLTVSTGDEGTSCYICTTCQHPSDPKPAQKGVSKEGKNGDTNNCCDDCKVLVGDETGCKNHECFCGHQPTQKAEWEERFEQLPGYEANSMLRDNARDFIRTELSRQRTALIEEVKKRRDFYKDHACAFNDGASCECYAAALDDILSKIEELNSDK